MKKPFIILIALAVLVGSLLACGGSDSNSGTISNNSGGNSGSSGSSGETGKTPEAQQHFKKGDVVKVGDTWEVTVNEVTAKDSDGDFNKPKEGKKFLVINITVKNISSKEETISSLLNFTVKTEDGTKAQIAILINGDPAPDGKVAAGDQVKGDLGYEVAADATKFTLAFQADIISSGQTIWDLNV